MVSFPTSSDLLLHPLVSSAMGKSSKKVFISLDFLSPFVSSFFLRFGFHGVYAIVGFVHRLRLLPLLWFPPSLLRKEVKLVFLSLFL